MQQQNANPWVYVSNALINNTKSNISYSEAQ